MLHRIVAEYADLREAELSMERHRSLIRQRHAGNRHMDRLLLQSLQQRAVEPRADAMSLDGRIEIDPCLDRLIESRMRPVSAAGGTADNTSRALRDEDLVRAT